MKVYLLSLGCARALVDSEGMAGLLDAAGHTLTRKPEEAECVVVNTCAFIQDAEEESISTILEFADWKRSGKLKRLYVAGCLPQKHREQRQDLLNLLPEVDGFIGTGDLNKLPQLIDQQQTPSPHPSPVRGEGGKRFFVASPVSTLLFDSLTPRIRLSPRHFAYMKISEGCDHACTFCSIPKFRGPHRSRSIEDLVQEAQRLSAEGVVELNLIGQDTSAYGADRYGEIRFPELLERLNKVSGIHWIRILYAHPTHVTDPLIRTMRDCEKVVPYIDIPFQHINDRLLLAMRRETNGARIRSLVRKFRDQIPRIAIRSTFIVGFPGETEQQFEELEQFLKEFRLERVGIFPYSPEPKTPSERMPDQVPDEVRQERLNRVMQLQQEVSRSFHQRFLGQTLEVLVDEIRSDGEEILGRTEFDAPEVDGQVFLKSKSALQKGPGPLKGASPFRVGEFVRAKVVDTYEYDLVAEVHESASALSA